MCGTPQRSRRISAPPRSPFTASRPRERGTGRRSTYAAASAATPAASTAPVAALRTVRPMAMRNLPSLFVPLSLTQGPRSRPHCYTVLAAALATPCASPRPTPLPRSRLSLRDRAPQHARKFFPAHHTLTQDLCRRYRYVDYSGLPPLPRRPTIHPHPHHL